LEIYSALSHNAKEVRGIPGNSEGINPFENIGFVKEKGSALSQRMVFSSMKFSISFQKHKGDIL